MRLTCDVEISNLNFTGSSKPSRASIALGRKGRTSDVIYVTISTARNKSGDSYQVKNNIEKIFSKFVLEGKCTIRFKEPPHDVSIKKADPLQLKIFLKMLNQCFSNDDLDGCNVPLISAVSTKTLSLSRQMTVTSRTQYPAIGKPFPSSLERLTINHCELKRIDGRIFNLYSLKSLHLGHNKISILPQELNPKCFNNLNELHLMHNRLTDISPALLLNLKNTLGHLDLSHNEITRLPDAICEMTTLRVLNCNYNKLSLIPRNIGLLTALRELRISNNNLDHLPGSVRNLHLAYIDLSSNNFAPVDAITSLPSTPDCSSMLECAATAVTKHKIKYSERDLPGILRNYLKTVIWSVCGSPCFQNYISFRCEFNLLSIADVTVTPGGVTVPIEFIICCQKCFNFCKPKIQQLGIIN